MSMNIAPDATALVMDSAPGFTSLLDAAGITALAHRENAWTNADRDNRPASEVTHPQSLAGTFDNRPTWDNPTPVFDNRPTWDNWKNK
ncbi:multiple cyclophane-containing RiPP AmcA [Streptomyces sp. NPDC002476]|uniref:multiple cyclophane-containing RiPP AmcA n=1 Tax=Streptomyces sp. NPDC002476 TaxID=3364648 RepID=UPI0036CA995A